LINSLLEHDAKQALQTGSANRHDSVCADCLYPRTGGEIRSRHLLLMTFIEDQDQLLQGIK